MACGSAGPSRCGNQLDVKRSRLCVALSTRSPAMSCARSSATSPPGRTIWPGCSCPSGRPGSPARPSTISCRLLVRPKARVRLAAHAPSLLPLLSRGSWHRSADHAGLLSATAPKHTAHYTGLPGTGSRACGGSAAREGTPRLCTTSWAVPPRTNTTSRRNRRTCAGHVQPPGGSKTTIWKIGGPWAS